MGYQIINLEVFLLAQLLVVLLTESLQVQYTLKTTTGDLQIIQQVLRHF